MALLALGSVAGAVEQAHAGPAAGLALGLVAAVEQPAGAEVQAVQYFDDWRYRQFRRREEFEDRQRFREFRRFDRLNRGYGPGYGYGPRGSGYGHGYGSPGAFRQFGGYYGPRYY